MPLWRSTSARAFEHNLRTELADGTPMRQALAIAYSVKRRAALAKAGNPRPRPRPGRPPARRLKRARAVR